MQAPGGLCTYYSRGGIAGAGDWGHEGQLPGSIRLCASALDHLAATRACGRRGRVFAVTGLAGKVMGSWDTPVRGLRC